MAYPPGLPDRDRVPPDELASYDRVIESQSEFDYDSFPEPLPGHAPAWFLDGPLRQPFYATLLNSPPIAAHISALADFYRGRGEVSGSYTHADREWADMVVGEELNNTAIYYIHMYDAVAVGVRPQAIKALREGTDANLTARERQLAQYIRRVIDRAVDREMYEEIEALLGSRGALEYTCFVSHLLMVTHMMRAFGLPMREQHEIDELIDAIIAGDVELPDSRARIPPVDSATTPN
jgi:hypothetical protein